MMLKWIKTLTNKGSRWVYVMGLDVDDNTVEIAMNQQDYEGEYTPELESDLDRKLRTYFRLQHKIMLAEIVTQRRIHNDQVVYEYDIAQHIAARGVDYTAHNNNNSTPADE
jgi:hypothetical protein